MNLCLEKTLILIENDDLRASISDSFTNQGALVYSVADREEAEYLLLLTTGSHEQITIFVTDLLTPNGELGRMVEQYYSAKPFLVIPEQVQGRQLGELALHSGTRGFVRYDPRDLSLPAIFVDVESYLARRGLPANSGIGI